MANASYQDISIDEYQAQFEQSQQDYMLVDVRETDEYAAGRIPGAVNLPLTELQARYNELPQDKTLVLVCARGGRSAQAAIFLATQGYDQDLYNLTDGTMGWMEEGLPVEQD